MSKQYPATDSTKSASNFASRVTASTSEPAVLVQEEAGIHVGIAPGLTEAATHATTVMHEKYLHWLEHGRYNAWGHYKRKYFVVAVGGGNTLKAQYQAMVQQLHSSLDWIGHVRFFFMEDSTGEKNWESPEQSLLDNLIQPLAEKLLKTQGIRTLTEALDDASGDKGNQEEVIERMIALMIYPIELGPAQEALKAKNRPLALKRARAEAERYQLEIESKLGATMVFHYIISGIGKNGALGAFAPYTPELSITGPGALVIKQGPKALRIALSRGVLTGAENISLIVSGSLKLMALGRFEMEDAVDFEQTVMETPLRMLRKSFEIAEKVYLFADEKALNFDETQFRHTEKGASFYTKAETRVGTEANGPHILLLHGFMGLFSFSNFLVRLPGSWTVSALHRGSHAKTLKNEEIFPHYARCLRQAILTTWSKGRAVPIAGHSIAGIISDHLLLSLLDDYEAPITPYAELKGSNLKLVDALRAGGIIHLATWAPVDGPHAGKNVASLVSHYRKETALDYSGFDRIYEESNGELSITAEASLSETDSLQRLNRFLQSALAQPMVNGLNAMMRSLLNYKSVQQKMLNTKSPYVLRLVGNRLLKTASFYGLCKEVNAAMHDPIEYQRRHLLALDIIVEYDIPFLSIVHEDDFMVSAKRHKEEHDYLLARRKKKEGVSKETELQTPVRFVKLKRAEKEMPLDPLNPHLMIMATSNEANAMSRQIITAMHRFVNENIAQAVKNGHLEPVASVKRWLRDTRPRRKSSKDKVA